MSTETIKITDIVPARYNPRQISNEDYNKLSNSINQFGLVDPIIINLTNNHIIGGHQRFDVLMDEYMSGNKDYQELILIRRGDIGWIFPDEELKVKDLNHEKALNLVLNKVQGEEDIEETNLEDALKEEEGTNTTSNTRTRKEHTCPSCGYVWIDGEEDDGI